MIYSEKMFRLCSECADFSDNVQNVQTLFRLFRMLGICSYFSDNVQNVPNLFRYCSECSVFSDNAQTLFSQCSECSESVQTFQNLQHKSWSIQNFLTLQCIIHTIKGIREISLRLRDVASLFLYLIICLVHINARKYQSANHKRTIQRNRQHKTKKNNIHPT